MMRDQTRDRVLAAATSILDRDGYAGLTMERIAAESGVAKTTLYRSWPTKGAVCIDLYFEVAARELHDPDTGDVARDLKHIANTVVRVQTKTVAGPALTGLIAEAQINGETRQQYLADFSAKRRQITRTMLRRAISRGQIRKDADVDLIIDAIGGAMTFRLLQRHAPLNRGFANALVDLVLEGCRKR